MFNWPRISCQLLELVKRGKNSTCELGVEAGYKNKMQHKELPFTYINVTKEHESSVLDALSSLFG
jgi:hypothetical protein